ncbi:MAG: magnesium/cobalt transporter CorA [Deltaproteobacteria bacterium]|nr:magnesium/cobalt transporter CorA [Deltaproteobacteria bacterium]
MARFLRKRVKKRGKPPGTLIYVGDHSVENIKVRLISFTQDNFIEKEIQKIEDCLPESHDEKTVTWIKIEGLSDTKTIREIGEIFDIHNLWLEDVLNTDHRPKMEELEDLVFLILKTVIMNGKKTKDFRLSQVSLFLGNNFVISFEDEPSDLFDTVIQRIKIAKGRIRSSHIDYLFFSLIDTCVDSYYPLVEKIGKAADTLEIRVLKNNSNDITHKIAELKSDLIYLKKSAGPLKESLQKIYKSENSSIHEKTRFYLSDTYDHIVHICDTIDSYKEMLIGLLGIYASQMSHKMNEIMKFLTIFASIFIPLTFIVGIYGMNFKNMPEIDWKWGYYSVWIIMITITSGLLYWFKKKDWL